MFPQNSSYSYKYRIITGIQLTKIDRVIQFIIVRVVENVLPESETWKAPIPFNLTGNNNHEYPNRKGIDDHTLTHEQRSLKLDTIFVLNGHVVTGVRLRLNGGGHLQLEIRVTDFDFATGKLINASQWLSNRDGGKILIDIFTADVSVEADVFFRRNKTENAYIRFGPTYNRSRRTIPSLDTHKVHPQISTLLADIGLHYKKDKKDKTVLSHQISLSMIWIRIF